VRFLLLRIEGTRGEARCVPVQTYPTLDAAVAAAAGLPNQPDGPWRPDLVDGVWRQTGRGGLGFVVHRIDSPQEQGRPARMP
jgi:hypothetical protein